MRNALNELRSAVVDKVPDGVTMQVKQGTLDIDGLVQPHEIKNKDYLFAIDDNLSGLTFPETLEKFGGPGIYVGRDAIFYRAPDNARQVRPWKDMPDFSLTKAEAVGWLGQWLPWITAATALAIFIGSYVGSFSGSVIFVLLSAALMLLLSRINRVNLRFEQWIAVGFHAVTLPTIVDLLTKMIGFPLPMAFSVIFALVIIAVSLDERRRPVVGTLISPNDSPPNQDSASKE